MPEPKVWAVQLDAETDAALELDRSRISGLEGREVTKSQYLRMLIIPYVHTKRSPHELGWSEGYRAGLADVTRDMQTLLHQLIGLHTDRRL